MTLFAAAAAVPSATEDQAEARPVLDLEVSEEGQVIVQNKSEDSLAAYMPPANRDDDDDGILEPATIDPSVYTITTVSDVSNLSRKIWVVTTAALPWRTGTAVNPLLRALYLTRGRAAHAVTLLLPWLPDAEQRTKLYGSDCNFQNPQDQEEWIREYCRERCQCANEEKNLRIRFWQGVYQESFGSIFPTEDICSLIPKEEADVAILEEPEHLNWFRVPAFTGDEDVTLGWAHMFQHVVGILHTNYAEYVRQYSMGASLITAPALNSLSALVVRAYCHQVIRLSDTLPTLCDKEVTSNVHGVGPGFLEEPTPNADRDRNLAPVYFIGKVIWAKGFYSVLELQERYFEETGEYFSMDVYGTGNDETAIKRAFYGRKGLEEQISYTAPQQAVLSDDESTSKTASGAANVFGKEASLRATLEQYLPPHDIRNTKSTDEDSDATSYADADDTPYNSDTEVNIEAESIGPASDRPEENKVFSILGDASEKAISTGIETAGATAAIIESLMAAAFSRKSKHAKSPPRKHRSKNPTALSLVPARARYKWRKTPLPARFLGTKDHAMLRDMPEHTIFLNMSTTEVLCTTTAEALAMGKYVILPKHPSNEFFYQFPNCLAYDSLHDCVAKLQYALSNRPEYLMDKYMHMLSWEGATERLYQAAAITEREQTERVESGLIARDLKAARFHVDGAGKSQMVKNIIAGGSGLLSRNNSSVSLNTQHKE